MPLSATAAQAAPYRIQHETARSFETLIRRTPVAQWPTRWLEPHGLDDWQIALAGIGRSLADLLDSLDYSSPLPDNSTSTNRVGQPPARTEVEPRTTPATTIYQIVASGAAQKVMRLDIETATGNLHQAPAWGWNALKNRRGQADRTNRKGNHQGLYVRGQYEMLGSGFNYRTSPYYTEAERLIEKYATRPARPELYKDTKIVLTWLVAWQHFALFEGAARGEGYRPYVSMGAERMLGELNIQMKRLRAGGESAFKELEEMGLIVAAQIEPTDSRQEALPGLTTVSGEPTQPARTEQISRAQVARLKELADRLPPEQGGGWVGFWSATLFQPASRYYRLADGIEVTAGLGEFNPFPQLLSSLGLSKNGDESYHVTGDMNPDQGTTQVQETTRVAPESPTRYDSNEGGRERVVPQGTTQPRLEPESGESRPRVAPSRYDSSMPLNKNHEEEEKDVHDTVRAGNINREEQDRARLARIGTEKVQIYDRLLDFPDEFPGYKGDVVNHSAAYNYAIRPDSTLAEVEKQIGYLQTDWQAGRRLEDFAGLLVWRCGKAYRRAGDLDQQEIERGGRLAQARTGRQQEDRIAAPTRRRYVSSSRPGRPQQPTRRQQKSFPSAQAFVSHIPAQDDPDHSNDIIDMPVSEPPPPATQPDHLTGVGNMIVQPEPVEVAHPASPADPDRFALADQIGQALGMSKTNSAALVDKCLGELGIQPTRLARFVQEAGRQPRGYKYAYFEQKIEELANE